MSLQSRAVQEMSCPADVIGLDAPSRPPSPAGRSPPKHPVNSPSGVSSGGLINPGFLVALVLVHQLLLWAFPTLPE